MDTLLAALEALETATARLTSSAEQLTSKTSGSAQSQSFEVLITELRSCCAEYKSKKPPITAPSHAAAVWRVACQLWNTAVDMTACAACTDNTATAVGVAWIRHVACELGFEVQHAALQELQELRQLQLIKFCLKASDVWAELERWEQAEVLLAMAARLVDATCASVLQQQGSSRSHSKAEECCALMYDVHLARYRAGGKLNQQGLAREALIKARTAAEELAPNASSSCLMCYKLARVLHEQAVQAMPEPQQEEGAVLIMASLEAAYELLGKAKDCSAAAQQAVSADAGGGAVAGGMVVTKVLLLESKVLLSLAYCQLTHCNDSASCLKCISAIRQLETQDAVNPAVALLAFQAFMAQGCLEQAEKEATGIAVNDAASKDACLSVVLALLEAPETATRAKPVLELVLGRFPSDPAILTVFTEQALSTARRATAAAPTAAIQQQRSSNSTGPAAAVEGTSSKAADVTQQGQQVCMQLEDLVLEQLERSEEGRQAVMTAPELHSRLYNTLYDYGVTKFACKDFTGAARFFAATLDVCEDRLKGRVARVLALCHMGLGQTSQASSYCSIADSYEPGDVGTSFVRFKLLLLQGDHAGVLAELQHMSQCRGFNVHMLWFAVRESVTVHATAVAKAALQQLLAQLKQIRASCAAVKSGTAASVDGADTAAPTSLSDCVVLRSLVKLQQQEFEELMSSMEAAAQGGEADLKQKQEALRMCIAQVSEQLNEAAVRLKHLGLEEFTGEKEAAAVQQVEWLSVVAWNTGLQAAALQDNQGTAVLMHICAQLLAQLPNLGLKQLKQQKMAYALAAAAGLEVHADMPEHPGSLKLASRMVRASIAVSQKLAAGQPGGADAASEAYDLQLLFKVALYQGNSKELAVVARRMASHPGVGPEMLYKLVDWCSQHKTQHPEVAVTALEGTLQKLMAVPSPDYSKAAWVMRTLLQRAASGDAKLKLYREACGILGTLQPGTYPPIEARWLCSTAWNTGIHHARFGRHQQAVDFMQTAIDMLPGCPQFQGKKCMMTQQIEQEKTAASANSAAPAAGKIC